MSDFKLDFLDVQIQRRLKSSQSAQEPLARALGLARFQKADSKPRIVDACFGWGIDALTMASWGFDILGFERNPKVFNITKQALEAARATSMRPVVERIELRQGQALADLNSLQLNGVVYLDPMYDLEQKGSASPKLRMQVLRDLVGEDVDRDVLVDSWLEKKREGQFQRLVLKAPTKFNRAWFINPSHIITEKTVRFFVWA